MKGICKVCGGDKEVEYCSLCKAELCENCRPNYVARTLAAMKELQKAIRSTMRIGEIR